MDARERLLADRKEEFDKAEEEIHNSPETATQTPEEQLRSYALLFHQVAGFYKWSYEDFRKTPWWLLKLLKEILDERANDLNTVIGYDEVSQIKTLRRMNSAF